MGRHKQKTAVKIVHRKKMAGVYSKQNIAKLVNARNQLEASGDSQHFTDESSDDEHYGSS